MWSQIRQKIVDVLNANAGSTIGVVYNYPTSTEDKYPAVNVIGAENDSDFGTGAPSNDNVQACVFTIRALYSVEDESNNALQTAETKIDAVLDLLIDLLSNPDVLSPACDFVEPVSASWGYQARGNGTVRIADIKIRCKKLK